MDTAGISGLMWPQSLWVLELRLHLWGQVATGSFEDSPMCYLHTGHPLQVLHKINGVLCEFDGVIVGLLQHDWDQVSRLYSSHFRIPVQVSLGIIKVYSKGDAWLRNGAVE